MDWNLTYTKKEREEKLYENCVGKIIVGHSKLKLWTCFWGHGEHEWPLNGLLIIAAMATKINNALLLMQKCCVKTDLVYWCSRTLPPLCEGVATQDCVVLLLLLFSVPVEHKLYTICIIWMYYNSEFF